jgi:trimethylamine:corrinoid methyltransferase-like protein
MHTLNNFRQENWDPRLFDRENYSRWMEQGGKDLFEVASLRWQEILQNYVKPDLGKDVEKSLEEFVAKRS